MKCLLLAISTFMLLIGYTPAHGEASGYREAIHSENNEQQHTKLKEMEVVGIAIDPFTNAPIVLLKDVEEKEFLPIVIGFLEALSIATVLEKIDTPRPMTHDLIKNIFDNLGVNVIKIEVNDVKLGTYFSLIYFEVDKKRFTIDSRPSDAIAIALRTGAPIFVNESVIQRSDKKNLMTQKGDNFVTDSTSE